METKTAHIAIIGRPNAGKSTLLNTLLGEKISIVSKKPQTTRSRITGILTKDSRQYIFYDTPGIHLPRSLLGKHMAKAVRGAVSDVDAALLVVEPVPRIGSAERGMLDKLTREETPVILLINKIDTEAKERILEVIGVYAAQYAFAAIIPISALNADGTDRIFTELEPFLNEGGFIFDEDEMTDQPEKVIASEMIREKALRLLDDEIPHGIAVEIEQYKTGKNGILNIRGVIYCEREGHKQIIIGKNGEMIKKIGSYARVDLEKFLGCGIYLELWVKVKEKWRDRADNLAEFGYK